MNIVVTGSSGFIGNNLVAFLNLNHHVIGLDRLEGNNTKIQIDCKSKNLKDTLNWEKIDLVIDCAAKTDLDGKTINDYNDNYVIIDRLIQICNNHQIKLIAFSSMLVNELPLNDAIDFNFYNPSTIYGQSKVLYEKKLKRKSKSYILVRPTSIWGPGFKEPYKNFFEYVIDGKFFVSDKSIVKTYCYIENLIQQILVLVKDYEKYKFSHQYFIDGNYNIFDWAKLIKLKSGNTKRKIILVPKPFFYFVCLIGDYIRIFIKKFPLNTFRFKNLNTNNIIDIKYSLFSKQNKIFSISEGVVKTLIHLNKINKC
tara:strand:- start:2336 stop:3268 length:933 start_codon:yes stop_codon:yes gene_type:complete